VNDVAELEKAVLALPIRQRALLAEALLQSLPPNMDDTTEAEEIAEVERRDHEIETGKVQPVTQEEFFRRVEATRKG
jgi:putative addiction module component (TIGR02574 family)